MSVTYDYNVIATTGQNAQNDSRAITSLGNLSSINDAGQVAFQGAYADGGNAVFVGNGSAGSLTSLVGSLATHAFESFVQITNQGAAGSPKVVAQDHFSSGTGPTLSFVRSWDTSAPGGSVVLGQGSTQPIGGYPFGSVLFPGISDSGRFVFLALPTGGSGQFLVTGPATNSTGFNELPIATLAVRPAIDNAGDVVLRFGATSTSPIQLYSFSLTSQTPTVVADTAMGFTALGQQPGISRDGKIVVFYGDLSASGSASLTATQRILRYSDGTPLALTPLTAGPGIFASIATAAGRVIQRIAGVAGNGQLDPGETYVNGIDVGPFSGFTPDSRLSVNSTSASAGAISIVFLATGTDTEQGVYSSTVKFVAAGSDPTETTSFQLTSHNLVVEQGATIPGSAGHIQTLSIYDSVNSKSEVVFWASTDQQQQTIVRADPMLPIFDFSSAQTTPEGWRTIAQSYSLAVGDLWGGKTTLNNNASDQLFLASTVGMSIGGYVLLDFTNSPYTGAEQVDKGLAQFDSIDPSPPLQFVWIDVELTDGGSADFNKTSDFQTTPGVPNPIAQQIAISYISDAACEVQKRGLTPVIYTNHNYWQTITGGSTMFKSLSLWDASTGPPTLDPFTRYGDWPTRAGRQYDDGPDGNSGEPIITGFNADLDVFAPSRIVPPPPLPGAVNGLTVATGSARVVLSWPAVAGAAGYNVYRSITPGGEGTPIAVLGTSFTDSALAPGTTYYYEVAAVGAFCEGPRSAEISVNSSIAGDLNGDGAVGFADLLVVAQNYGKMGATLGDGDINGDGRVDFADLLILAQNYGHSLSHAPMIARSSVVNDLLSHLLRDRHRR